jgi:hypothetical protein
MPLVRRISVIIAIVAGLAVLLDFFIEQEAIDSLGRVVVDWVMILAAVAIVLGLLNLASVHTGRIASTHPSWPYSLALLAALLVTVLIGFAPGNSGANDPALNWLFSYIYQPLAAAVLSLLAFYIASAAYRTLRLRTWEAAGLMIAAVIVLLGQIPLAAQIGDIFPQARTWLLSVVSTAGLRGILIAAALGAILTGLRIILGLDRHYLDKDN